MSFVLVSMSTPMIKGLSSLREALKEWDSDGLSGISSVYRRADEGDEATFAADLVLVFSLETDLDLESFRKFVAKQKGKTPGVRSELLTYNQDVHLDPQSPIPHPDLHLDALVLRCAAEIRGGFEHPVLGQSLQELVKSSPSSRGSSQFEFLARGESLLTARPEDT